MILKGEKVILVPYTIEMCHEFYKEYVADPFMSYCFRDAKLTENSFLDLP